MIKATYDTNTLVSGISISHSPVSFIIDAWINDEVEMVTSKPLIEELHRTLQKSYFTSRLTQKQIQSFITIVKEHAVIIPITTPIPKVATHPEDDIVLATGESGKVAYIVTGDHGLQDLKRFKNIEIVSPLAFSKLLM